MHGPPCDSLAIRGEAFPREAEAERDEVPAWRGVRYGRHEFLLQSDNKTSGRGIGGIEHEPDNGTKYLGNTVNIQPKLKIRPGGYRFDITVTKDKVFPGHYLVKGD